MGPAGNRRAFAVDVSFYEDTYMRMSHSVLATLFAITLLCAFTSPAFAAESAPAKKSAPAKSSAKAKKSESASTSAPAPVADGNKLKADLDVFAKSCVISMNRQIKPGINTKQVTKTPDGYRAHYTAVDPDSLNTSYSPSEHKIVPYIGRMMYHEVEYVSSGKTEKDALAGPFSEVNRRPMTELIKYMKGKWTY